MSFGEIFCYPKAATPVHLLLAITRRPLWILAIQLADVGSEMLQMRGCRLSGADLRSRYDSFGSIV